MGNIFCSIHVKTRFSEVMQKLVLLLVFLNKAFVHLFNYNYNYYNNNTTTTNNNNITAQVNQ